MKALSVPSSEPLPGQEAEVSFSIPPDVFASAVMATACVEGSGSVTLVRLKFMGDAQQLSADLAALRARWSDGRHLPLGVADSFSSTDVTGFYREVAYDQRGWQAMMFWEDNRAGMTSLTVGIRQGHPSFITERVNEDGGVEFKIDHDLMNEQAISYQACKKWP